ncbi:MAG: hypothetical protein ACXU8U_10265 [Asticcacaulis sp.]
MRIVSFLPVAAGLLLLCPVLCQCSRPQEPASSASAGAAPPNLVMDFKITLTPEALARVKAHKQKLTATALYYGNARPSSASLADKSDGTIHLSLFTIPLEPMNQTVHMNGKGIDPAMLDTISGRKPLVLINVFSGAKVDDTQIQCTSFQDYVTAAEEKPVEIQCK